MGDSNRYQGDELSRAQKPAIRFLVESALEKVASEAKRPEPHSRQDWVDHICQAVMSDGDLPHQTALARLMASGVTTEELFHSYVPAIARQLGELWLGDEASFVDVTVGAARLQTLFRSEDEHIAPRMLASEAASGDAVLMIVPEFEHHSLGAFVAADEMRRHGLWVQMGIGLKHFELADLTTSKRFSMIGLTAATWKSVEKAAEIVDYLKAHCDDLAPIVVGGSAVVDKKKIEARTGADFAVGSVKEAIDLCGLRTAARAVPLDHAS